MYDWPFWILDNFYPISFCLFGTDENWYHFPSSTFILFHLFSDDLHLEPCCQYEFYRMKSYLPAEEEEKEKEDEFGASSFARLRKFVWELFEEPNKTKLGKVPPLLLNILA